MKNIKCEECQVAIVKDHNSRRFCAKCSLGRKRARNRMCGKNWRMAHPEKNRKRAREYNRKHREYVRRRAREYMLNIRTATLLRYGNKCECCGESTKQFLSIDHINGGGSKHRKEIKGSIYFWLKKNNYPKGYRVLCHNCNMAKAFYGKCPHTI